MADGKWTWEKDRRGHNVYKWRTFTIRRESEETVISAAGVDESVWLWFAYNEDHLIWKGSDLKEAIKYCEDLATKF